MTQPVFVFGSNLAGRHGKGAALAARSFHGAVKGQGWGRMGNSYAIPTKDFMLRTLPLPIIEHFCRVFITYAGKRPGEQFELTPIGCGLAGYAPWHIAPFFVDAPANVIKPDLFK